MSVNIEKILQTGYKQGASQGYDVNRFDYYSGSQITVWFGDIMIDDIASIQFSRSQSKRPIYGYASQQFDAVAKGTVIVQGSFLINFRQAGYLSAVMSTIVGLYGQYPQAMQVKAVKDTIGNYLKVGKFGPMANTKPEDQARAIKDIGNDPQFLNLVRSYENIIWGDGLPEQADVAVTNGPSDMAQQELIPDGFTILVSYGNLASSDPKTLSDYVQSTTKSIVGVHLVGESQVIQVGGQPVMEQYDFIARGTDENIGTSR